MQKIASQIEIDEQIFETVIVAIDKYHGEHSDDHRVTDILGHLLSRDV